MLRFCFQGFFLLFALPSCMNVLVPSKIDFLSHTGKRDTFTVTVENHNITEAVSYESLFEISEIGGNSTKSFPGNETSIKIDNICVAYNVCLITTWMSVKNHTNVTLKYCKSISMEVMYKLMPMTVTCRVQKKSVDIIFKPTYVKVIYDVIYGDRRDRYTTNKSHHVIPINYTGHDVKINHVFCMECSCYNNDTTICSFERNGEKNTVIVIVCVVIILACLTLFVLAVVLLKRRKVRNNHELLKSKDSTGDRKL